jgi:hypothetical protein
VLASLAAISGRKNTEKSGRAQIENLSLEGYFTPKGAVRLMGRPVNRETVNDTAKLIMHRLIARELARDPTLVERARIQLGRMAARFPDRSFVHDWEAVLRRPTSEIAAVLTGRNQEARWLRLSSPFILADGVDFKNEALRRRIGQAARRIATRTAAARPGPPVA